MSDTTEAPQVVFRAVKKRKYRQKQAADDREDSAIGKSHAPADADAVVKKEPDDNAKIPIQDDKASDDEAALAEALRRRNAHKSRLKGGVAFRAESAVSEQRNGVKGEHDDDAKMEEDEDGSIGGIVPINKRFAPQTGIIGELVNKHMEEYIESELAKRRSPLPQTPSASASGNVATSSASADQSMPAHPAVRPSIRGKIVEVDLGKEAREQNIALTELATRKFVDGESGAEQAEEGLEAAKVKLGRDGKPLRARNRRGSDDIERDRMVEELMRENKLDVYDSTTLSPGQADDEFEGAADDRIAEKFRREFMDAMFQRRRRRAAARSARSANKAKANANSRKDEPILRGPKLGGSRNARAAMRDKLLEQQQAQKPQHPAQRRRR